MRLPSVLILATLALSAQTATDGPLFTADNQLTLPKDYRQWTFLSSGLGMTYDPNPSDPADPSFNNVFVNPSAYRAFVETGHWPDHTMFVLEIRSSTGQGSINNGGHYQTGIRAIEAEVKDEKRFPQKWAFFPFGDKQQATALPAASSCNACHDQNAAVETPSYSSIPRCSKWRKPKELSTRASEKRRKSSPRDREC